MSSNADFDRALNAGIDLINKDRQYGLGLKPQPNAGLLAELMDDMKEEEAEYAAFNADKPKPPTWQRALLAIIMIVLVFAALWVGGQFVSNGLPALFDDRTTHQVEQPDNSGEVIKNEPWLPTPGDIQQQTPTIEEPLGGYSASIVPPPAGNAPSMESTPTQNGSPSGDVAIPFGALPELIEIDPPTASDATAGHLEKLQPFGW